MNKTDLQEKVIFPNYTQIPTKVPLKVWHLFRTLSITSAVFIVLILIFYPDKGLFIIWKVLFPLLPIVFLFIPGLWRNICPLAALNQLPRLFGFSRGLNPSNRIKEYGYVIGISMFFILASSRKVIFNESGIASAFLIVSALIFAFIGGIIFKGKGGWCSTICPLLPVQRLYAQTPFVTVPNSHCKPCQGCAKNCYDFNPSVAYLADQYDKDKHYIGYRRFFAAAFPGFILAFYLVPNPPVISIASMYFQMITYVITGIGIFFLLDSFAKVTANKLTALCAAISINIFYWFNFPILLNSYREITGYTLPEESVWISRGILFLLTFVWLKKSFAIEKVFVAQAVSSNLIQTVKIGPGAADSINKISLKEQAEITFVPDDKRVSSEFGRSILELTESCGLSIESGCRMGVCGADPIAVKEGMENLTSISDDEKSTLARLGYADNTRMACCARIKGNVTVTLMPDKRITSQKSTNTEYDLSIKSVVIIGNGIAGVTTADHIRRRHPKCEIHLIGREKNHLYNRMGISRLIYGRSAMQGLYLLPDTWYDEHNISCWINTHVSKVDIGAHKVELATGENLDYDKLVLAMGSRSFVPGIEGYGSKGTFTLREADDAMNIRNFVQRCNCKNAVVAGGGLLGLEAAYALHKLGLHVSVLERGSWPLQRQLDSRGGKILKDYLQGLGLNIITESEISKIKNDGENNVCEVLLKDGSDLKCEVFLICAGVQPNTELAKDVGININRGIIVDAEMRTNIENVFAVGDLAECNAQLFGLWPVAVEQAEVAAVNVTGGNSSYKGCIPTTMLKVVGAEVTSIGKFESESPDDIVIIIEDSDSNKYKKLVISQNKIVGAILIGYPIEGPLVTKAVKSETNISSIISSLRNGSWNELSKLVD